MPFQITNVCIPQKIGEVIAQIHFLASAEFLRCGNQGNTPQEIHSKGLLIDKNIIITNFTDLPLAAAALIENKLQASFGTYNTYTLWVHIT